MLLSASDFAVNSSYKRIIRLRSEDVLLLSAQFECLSEKYWEKPCGICPTFDFNFTSTRDHNFLNSSTALKILAASSCAVVFLP
jgi:hypothetical protein